MARILSEESVEQFKRVMTRSWRVQFFTDLSIAGDYVVEFFREKVVQLDNEPPMPTGEQTRHSRKLSELLTKEVTVSGNVTLTGAQIAEAIAKMGDIIEEEDIPNES